VVSKSWSWRQKGLLEAANFTGLQVRIPAQPAWTTREVDQFRGYGNPERHSQIGPGQAQCWLGHLNAIKYALSNSLSTFLIVEDDVDWDISIKYQLSLVAPVIRNLTASEDSRSVYGGAWDLLWLGHCGDVVPKSGVQLIHDDTLPKLPLYRENDGRYTRVKQHTRMVYQTNGPICTYAYAITSQAAKTILSRAGGGMDRIITKELRQWCALGFLRCITVNPELFHHHKKAGEVASQIAVVEGWNDLAIPAAVDYTANIRYSARCNSKQGRRRPLSCQNEFGSD
jgi:hypothetical protein